MSSTATNTATNAPMSLSSLLDPSRMLPVAVGRPRRALWVGGAEGSEIAAERGAEIVREEVGGVRAGHDGGDPQTPAPFDLAFVASAAARGDLAGALAGVVGRLSDGGHVVVHGPGLGTSTILAALQRAGLVPLWRDGTPVSSPTMVVARRPPARRALSLTVGMISMNEEGAVGKVIDGIRGHVPAAEILLVDSSKDRTPEIAEARGARVLRQFPPRGYGPAMTRLLYSATTDVIVTMDCDGTYPADRIAELHRRVEEGADLVNTSRTHHWSGAMPFPNFLANRTFAAVSGVVHGVRTTDVHSGMRAYRTSMLRGMYVEEKGLALPVELMIAPARHGYRVEDVNIDYFERIGTTTLQRWNSTVWTFRRIARAAWMGGAPIR
jgi:Glycosyl transferase family 2